MKSKSFLKCFMAQKVSKDIVKIVHVTSVFFIHFMKLREYFLALNVVDVLLSMEGQRALGFHQKYVNLCSEDERRSYGFGTMSIYNSYLNYYKVSFKVIFITIWRFEVSVFFILLFSKRLLNEFNLYFKINVVCLNFLFTKESLNLLKYIRISSKY